MKFIGTQFTGVCQTFGKFTSLRHPGFNLYIPFVQTIKLVANNIQNQEFKCMVKTCDDVFSRMQVQVQVQVRSEDTEKAFFMLQDCTTQIDAYVQNIVRAESSKLTLNKLFESQTEIAEAVSKNLKEKMSGFGYTIIDTLVTDIKPADEVAIAMNKIYASERLKMAAKNEADANYIKEVRQAEADRDRKILQGEGVSGQRLAILKGYESGIEKMADNLGLSPKEIIEFVMKTQYYDMLEAVGRSPNAKTVFIPHNDSVPSSVPSLRDQFMQALENVQESHSTVVRNAH
jgi:regulator of protease activity HflC (stomatin/prohibitin superfamily)